MATASAAAAADIPASFAHRTRPTNARLGNVKQSGRHPSSVTLWRTYCSATVLSPNVIIMSNTSHLMTTALPLPCYIRYTDTDSFLLDVLNVIATCIWWNLTAHHQQLMQAISHHFVYWCLASCTDVSLVALHNIHCIVLFLTQSACYKHSYFPSHTQKGNRSVKTEYECCFCRLDETYRIIVSF